MALTFSHCWGDLQQVGKLRAATAALGAGERSTEAVKEFWVGNLGKAQVNSISSEKEKKIKKEGAFKVC